MFKIKIKSFIPDLIVIFTDFKEKLMDGYTFEHTSKMDSRTLKTQRDKYLQMYQGIMFSMENLCFKSMISVFKVKDSVRIYLVYSKIFRHTLS
jgi:hypothetical protein